PTGEVNKRKRTIAKALVVTDSSPKYITVLNKIKPTPKVVAFTVTERRRKKSGILTIPIEAIKINNTPKPLNIIINTSFIFFLFFNIIRIGYRTQKSYQSQNHCYIKKSSIITHDTKNGNGCDTYRNKQFKSYNPIHYIRSYNKPIKHQ